ncbi:sigma-70 family RNA polymerase sigma factor [Blastopirellula marina]|uniref:Probable RNA polymerase sigma factor rfaY n=1 Tax=Blastopirellula marina DSM 3645 TaxID=314230 RepID=A3ZRP9_9BACT|nr:sigma-70 family RNA polymerase sigma factor [Blastopirellula marina]EAQ80818.1 probable RNA polymerase sigma factor rfaY [Blastopirellula marina DSM 3645]
MSKQSESKYQLETRKTREQLARRWVEAQPSVLAFLISMTPQFSDAEDLLQEVAAEVAIRFDEYDPTKPFLHWALWVSKIKIADFYRSQKRDKLIFAGEAIDALAAACTRVQDLISEEQQALDECLKRTVGRGRQLLTLRYGEDLKPQEIAARLGMTALSVRVTLSRTRSALSDCVRRRIARANS